jgi:heme oxygenase
MTRPDHDAFEGTLGLLDTELELAYYKIVLTRFHGFWRGWQPYVAGLLDDETLLAPRRRLELLDADLRTLGLSKSDIEALPTCPPPRLENAAEALGSLYVMEGSTLGGRRILRNTPAASISPDMALRPARCGKPSCNALIGRRPSRPLTWPTAPWQRSRRSAGGCGQQGARL